jgi:hypothetical protein
MFAARSWVCLAAVALITLLPALEERVLSQTPNEVAAVDGRHDFDFLFGHWNIRNRRLRNPLSGSTEWHKFASTSTEAPLLGGLGNLEQYDAPEAPGRAIHAVAVRLFDVTSRKWSIYWSTVGSGAFSIPTVGSFTDGVGHFYDHEEYKGRPIVVRFTWTRGDDAHCRWEQAFSANDGRTWETNWIMAFTRA